MYSSAELVMHSYKPLHLSKGMLFSIQRKEYIELQALDWIPLHEDSYIKEWGYPIELYIVDKKENVLASPQEIGWMDDGEEAENLRDVTLKDINKIFNEYGGTLLIDMKEELVPEYMEEKVVIKFLQNEELLLEQ